MNLLFMCVANSARSQLAEALARQAFGADARIESAGSEPSKLNPFAVRAMAEVGVDISGHRSKAVKDLEPEFLGHISYVITLCAEEVCPAVLSAAPKLHWPFPDPAGHGGTDEEQLQRFRETREAIRERIERFRCERA